MSATTRLSIWMRLQQAQLVQGDLPEAGDASSPWFIRVMLGFAGWLGALFLLGFIGSLFAVVFRSSASAVVAGAIACAGAVGIFRAAPKSDFMAQFGLAASLAGQVLLLFGFAGLFHNISPTQFAWCFLLQEAALFVLIPNFLHRILCALGGSLAATWLLIDAGLIAFTPAAISAGFLAVWLSEFRFERRGALLRAGGYGLALASVLTAVAYGGLWFGFLARTGHLHAIGGEAVDWIGRVASALVLVAAVIALLRREGLALDSGQGRVGLAAAVILGAVSIKAPGIGPAAAILVVGYANGNRVLAGLGILALLGYLSHYYYSLQTTLLYKSGLLALTGIALLIARLALHHWWPEEKEASHA